jgi:AAA ATPase domain/AAA domain, putative AbiEii toxin, Type IV TA system
MKLESVSIHNFRSIKEVTIKFDYHCLILVGINESGKSNILKALSSLGPYMPTLDEVREPSPGEASIELSEIRFEFTLKESDTATLLPEIEKLILVKSKNPAVATMQGNVLTLPDFMKQRSNGLFDVDVLKQKKTGRYWAISKDFEIAPGWLKPSKLCPSDFQYEGHNISGYRLIYAADFVDLPTSYTEPATIDDLAKMVGLRVSDFIDKHLPHTLLWQYTESNLLPSTISMDEFVADPNTCIPLRNMFRLAGIENIPSAISDARSKSRNSLDNFFSNVAAKTTKHFRSVWKEHKGIEFSLRPDGPNLIPGVREKNVFDFSRRSDGFKRFISFLLLVSANVQSGHLSDTLLLVDEPDISLHPSGARFLRDELIKIGAKNVVVYSTHSIFMVDREQIGRHLIVSKVDEETKTNVAGDSNLMTEEVLFNAIGYSIFETLRQKNIIFEGWKDKQLFVTALKKVPASHAHLREFFGNIGLCHARGVKSIKSITPMIELANRDCVIISDGDAPARERQMSCTRFC